MGNVSRDGLRSSPSESNQEEKIDLAKKTLKDSPTPIKENPSSSVQSSSDQIAEDREFYIQEIMRENGLSRKVAEAQVDSFF